MKPSKAEQLCMNLVHSRFSSIRRGRLTLALPDGTAAHFGEGLPSCVMKINRYRFYTRLIAGGNVGLGEAWTDEDWDSDDPTGVLQLFIANMDNLKTTGLTKGLLRRLLHLVQHALNRNTVSGSRRNIHAHYDLGNDFYRTFLDHETMMYSSALFHQPDESLAQAQKNKIHRLIDLARIGPAQHILEIGCGWGGFAVEAARKTGCRVTGITISEEQHRYATERVKKEGLEDRVDIVLCDYRNMEGAFDRIVSIEMLEAVGHAYYGTFFSTCDRLLKPGGRAVLQVITIPDQRYAAYRRNPDWIQKYIFPGGMLPSLTELAHAMTRHSALIVEHLDNIGIHYAETLRRWRASVTAAADDLADLGYDGTFMRKWIYYLCYCEAGFQSRFINDLHLTLVRPAEQDDSFYSAGTGTVEAAAL